MIETKLDFGAKTAQRILRMSVCKS
jgi:hypothetical protein